MSDHDSITSSPAVIRYSPIKPGYRVGTDGSVWSCIRIGKNPVPGDTWRRLKPCPNPRGHLSVHLGIKVRGLVHRFVLEAFVGPCPPGMECLHADDDPSNNALSNLSWGTRRQNLRGMVERGRSARGEKHRAAILTNDKVQDAYAMHLSGLKDSEIARKFGVHRITIFDIVHGVTWTHITGLTRRIKSRAL